MATVDGSPPPRSCGGCHVCCEVTAVYPDNNRSSTPLCKSFEKCPHQCENGCAIYENRPVPCAAYTCMWLLGWATDEDRPDKLGMLFEATPDMPELIMCIEAWPEAARSKAANQRLWQLRMQKPLIMIRLYGTNQLGMLDPPPEIAEQLGEDGIEITITTD